MGKNPRHLHGPKSVVPSGAQAHPEPAPPSMPTPPDLPHSLQFGKYLLEKKRAVWASHYIDYKALKDLIKESATAAEQVSAGVPVCSHGGTARL